MGNFTICKDIARNIYAYSNTSKDFNKDLIRKSFSFLDFPCLIEIAELQELGFDGPAIKALADHPLVKIVKASNNSHLKIKVTSVANAPFLVGNEVCVNIDDTKNFRREISLKYKANEQRHELRLYLKKLMSQYQKVAIHDKYFFDTFDPAITNFSEILDNHHDVEIFSAKGAGVASNKSTPISDIVKSLKLSVYNSVKMHDRYIKLSKNGPEITIMLSSGFEYVFNDNKEITALIIFD